MILNGIRGKQVKRIAEKNSLPVIIYDSDNGTTTINIKYIRSILQNNKEIQNVILNYSDMSKEFYDVFRELALTCKTYNRKLLIEGAENKKIIKKRLSIFEPLAFIGNSGLFDNNMLTIGYAIVKKDYRIRISDKELVSTYDFIDDSVDINAFESIEWNVEKAQKIKAFINAIEVYKSKEFSFVKNNY